MKKIKFSLLAAITVISLLLLSACGTMEPCRSELPWARPAGWENSSPGVSF